MISQAKPIPWDACPLLADSCLSCILLPTRPETVAVELKTQGKRVVTRNGTGMNMAPLFDLPPHNSAATQR